MCVCIQIAGAIANLCGNANILEKLLASGSLQVLVNMSYSEHVDVLSQVCVCAGTPLPPRLGAGDRKKAVGERRHLAYIRQTDPYERIQLNSPGTFRLGMAKV